MQPATVDQQRNRSPVGEQSHLRRAKNIWLLFLEARFAEQSARSPPRSNALRAAVHARRARAGGVDPGRCWCPGSGPEGDAAAEAATRAAGRTMPPAGPASLVQAPLSIGRARPPNSWVRRTPPSAAAIGRGLHVSMLTPYRARISERRKTAELGVNHRLFASVSVFRPCAEVSLGCPGSKRQDA